MFPVQMTSSPSSFSARLEALLTRYTAAVEAAAARRGLPSADVGEVFQEVRIRLWKALDAEKIDRVRASYVYRTAVSAAIDLIRRRRARAEDPLDTAASELRATAPGPQATLEGTELEGHVVAALNELVASRRTVVRMYLAGYKREEIADLLGWSEAKTRNLLYRGLADLRAALARRGVGPGGMG